MLKHMMHLEEKVEDRTYIFPMLPNADAGEVLSVLFKFRSQVIDIINKAHEVDAPKPAETPQEEVVNVE